MHMININLIRFKNLFTDGDPVSV